MQNISYEAIQAIAPHADLALVAVSFESSPAEAQRFFEQDAIVLPAAQNITRIGIADLLAIIPTAQVEASLKQMLAHFAQHSLAQKNPPLTLHFGWAHGPYATAAELIEAVARNLVQQSQSSSRRRLTPPLVLMLEPKRSALQRRYDHALSRYNVAQRALKSRYGSRERRFQTEIDQLTAVVQHDLNSGFGALKRALDQLVSPPKVVPPALDRLRTWINQRIVVCTAWQNSIVQLGSGQIPQVQTINISEWVIEQLFLLRDQLEIPLRIEVQNCPEALLVTLDPRPLLVACLRIILAARDDGAQTLHFTAHIAPDGKRYILTFVDDGRVTQRLEAIQPTDSTYPSQAALKHQSLMLLPHMLQQQGITVQCRRRKSSFQVLWDVPGNQPSLPIPVFTLTELEDEVLRLEQEVTILDAQLDKPLDSADEFVAEQAQKLLLPYVQELGNNLQTLMHRAEQLTSFEVADPIAAQRIVRLSFYGYLIVRNLMLALQGLSLPVEEVNLNDEVQQVVDMLQHKLARLTVLLDLTPNLPDVLLSVVETKQVLMNILKNASEATASGGTLKVTTFLKAAAVAIRFADTGMGIPPKNQEKIFELHFSTRGTGKNSGVGLHAIQTIVQRAGGKIGVASASYNDQGNLISWQAGPLEPISWTHSGTIFHIEFPLA